MTTKGNWLNKYKCTHCDWEKETDSMSNWIICPKCKSAALTKDITFRTKGADLKKQ